MLGGVLADISWRGPFLIYLAAFVVLPSIIWVLYEPTPAEQCAEMPNPVSDPGDCVAGAIQIGKRVSNETEYEPVPIRLTTIPSDNLLVPDPIWGRIHESDW